MPETDASLFADNGYQVVQGILDNAVVSETRAFLEGEIGKALDVLRPTGPHSDVADIVDTIDGIVDSANPDSLDPEIRAAVSGLFCLRTRLSEKLWAISRQPQLRKLLCTALSTSRLFMHMPPVARFVLPNNRHPGVPPHQDISYNRHMSDFVTVWVPLVPIDDRCGGVSVFKGSANSDEIIELFDGGLWQEPVPTVGYQKIDCVPILPGDILMMNKRIVHASMPNKSDRTRLSIDFRFFGENARSTKHYLDMQNWEVIPPP